ncbi:MAG: periplasmic flagellar collar protein FlcA, partial [Treponemataceae bacterium]
EQELVQDEETPSPDFGFSDLADETEQEKTIESADVAAEEQTVENPQEKNPDIDIENETPEENITEQELVQDEETPSPDFGFSDLADETEQEKTIESADVAAEEQTVEKPQEENLDTDIENENPEQYFAEQELEQSDTAEEESENDVSQELIDTSVEDDDQNSDVFFDNTQADQEADEVDDSDIEDEDSDIEQKDRSVDGFNLDGESLADKFNFSDDDLFVADEEEYPRADSSFNADHSKNDIISKEDYDLFLKNLNDYPLNLRLEIEKIIVENEFTEEVVSDLFKLVLKKTPAVNLADHVGNLLGTSIEVPHNFEKRSAAEYEAYKASAGYQLKSRILPAALILILLSIGGFFAAKLANQFIVRPFLANKAYKEGYVLLENKIYPQSELKFLDGLAYNPSKKWMFAYADKYRDEKQFDRARRMYDRGLQYYPKDKNFGLQYSEMELYDLVNYEKAEEIVRRKVLDNFVNDKDGVLLLGDIFLEWASDVDPSKFVAARAQYEFLMEEYGANDLYQSRMMRYFIRTDNLREVIQLKAYFLPNEKALGAKDLVELSEYLLDKQYEELKPADEYLRWYIEDVRKLLERAITADPRSADAQYNLSRHFVETGNRNFMERQLQFTLQSFKNMNRRTRKQMLKNIDTYR